ncbi:MAG: hypothetical protein ACE5OR_16235 [bacterium]
MTAYIVFFALRIGPIRTRWFSELVGTVIAKNSSSFGQYAQLRFHILYKWLAANRYAFCPPIFPAVSPIAKIFLNKMDMVRGDCVIQDAQTIALFGIEEPNEAICGDLLQT